MKRILAVLLIALLYLPVAATTDHWKAKSVAQTKVLQPSKDNTLIESPTGALSNGKGDAFFVGRTGQVEGSIRRGLIAFDIASAVPAGSKITSVKLALVLIRSAGGGQPTPVILHRVLKDWGEGDSTAAGPPGTSAAKGDATWKHTFYDTQEWARLGAEGDYEPQKSAAQTVANTGVYTWASTPRMVADVQAWLNSPKENFGWIILGDESEQATAKLFHSRESTDEAARPKLTVKFVPPTRKKK